MSARERTPEQRARSQERLADAAAGAAARESPMGGADAPHGRGIAAGGVHGPNERDPLFAARVRGHLDRLQQHLGHTTPPEGTSAETTEPGRTHTLSGAPIDVDPAIVGGHLERMRAKRGVS